RKEVRASPHAARPELDKGAVVGGRADLRASGKLARAGLVADAAPEEPGINRRPNLRVALDVGRYFLDDEAHAPGGLLAARPEVRDELADRAAVHPAHRAAPWLNSRKTSRLNRSEPRTAPVTVSSLP